MTNKLYLYDPRTNVSTETTYDYLEELTGMKRTTLQTNKSRKQIIRNIGCYIIDENTTLKERQQYYSKVVLDDEVWLNVEGSGGTFIISNHGRIKRIYKHVEPKFIMPYLRKQNGHLYAKVRFDGEYKTYKIAHLVAHHFIGNNQFRLSVRHKNGIKTDCFSGNLEYISKQNLGRLTGAMSTSKPVVQLCPESKSVIDEFRSVRETGRETFMSYQAVLDNCNGKTELAGGVYKFMFLDDYEADGTA